MGPCTVTDGSVLLTLKDLIHKQPELKSTALEQHCELQTVHLPQIADLWTRRTAELLCSFFDITLKVFVFVLVKNLTES